MRALLLGCMLLLLGLCAFARPLSQPLASDEREALALMHEIECYRAMSSLDLTAAQQAALLPILTAYVDELIAAREAKAKAQPALLPAMENLRKAVLANNGVADEIKGAVYRAEAPYKIIEERMERETPQRVAQVWALLTTAQGARLRRIGRLGEIDDKAFIAAMATRLNRRMKDTQRQLNLLYRAYGLYGDEIPKAAEFGKPILEAWQQLPADQAEAQRGDVMNRLLALPDTGILQSKPDDAIERLISLAVLTQKSLHYLNPKVPLPPVESVESPQVQATVADIRVLNLVNTLYLTPEQTRELLAMQNQARAEYDVLYAKQLDGIRASLPLLRQVRDAWTAGKQPALALREQMKALEGKRQEYAAADKAIDVKYLGQLKELLTDNQVTMIANFVPCTVPVQSLTNPERVGQADSTNGIEKALERIRKAPDDKLPKMTERLQAGIRYAFERKRYKDEQIKSVLEKVPGIVADIRVMEDAEFELKKKEIAESLAVPAHIADGRELDTRILTYLLAPNLTPILQRRSASQTT